MDRVYKMKLIIRNISEELILTPLLMTLKQKVELILSNTMFLILQLYKN